jgi:LysM repeat protein
MLLAFSMVFTLLPTAAMAEVDTQTPELIGKIIAFEPLEKIEITVEVGTAFETLPLPATLTATVKTAALVEEQPARDSGAVPVRDSGEDLEEASPTIIWDEITEDIPVSWESTPEYDGETAGSYVFTPIIENYYVRADLPTVTVVVGERIGAPLGAAPALLRAAGAVIPVNTEDELRNAIETAEEDNIIQLMQNITLTKDLSINTGRPQMTLDLNGNTIDNAYYTINFLSGNTLTIEDSGKDGSIIASYAHAIVMYSLGSITVNSGHIQSNADGKSAIYNAGSGSVIINDGTISTSGAAAHAIVGGVESYGNVTVNGGTIEASGNEAHAIFMQIAWRHSEVAVTDGTITSTSGSAIYSNAPSGNVTLTGGTLSSTNGIAIVCPSIPLLVTAGSPIIQGGEKATDKAPNVDSYDQVRVIASQDYDGATTETYSSGYIATYRYLSFIMDLESVAKVGDNYYDTIIDAFDAIHSMGTITILRDVTLTTTVFIRDSAQKNITIDLNGKTLQAGNFSPLQYQGDGNLTINGGGTITSNGNGLVLSSADSYKPSEFTLSNITVTSNGSSSTAVDHSGGSLTVTNCTISATAANSTALKFISSETVELTGSNISTTGEGSCAVSIASYNSANATLSNCIISVDGTSSKGILNQSPSSVTFKSTTNSYGATITTTKEASHAIENTGAGRIVIASGTVKTAGSSSHAIHHSGSGSISVEGGVIIAQGSSSNGINNTSSSANAVTLSGGEINSAQYYGIYSSTAVVLTNNDCRIKGKEAALNSAPVFDGEYPPEIYASNQLTGSTRKISVSDLVNSTSSYKQLSLHKDLSWKEPNISKEYITVTGGSGTNGAFRPGDTMTMTWDNSATGQNNKTNISSLTFSFYTILGGSSADHQAKATNDNNIWTASFVLPAGSFDWNSDYCPLSVDIRNEYMGRMTTVVPEGVVVDLKPPTVTNSAMTIGSGSAPGGTFQFGDVVHVSWNNSSTGDNNNDIVSVTVDFSEFGADSAVEAVNNNGTWTASYTINNATAIGTNRKVSITVTDDAGNVTTLKSDQNRTVNFGGCVTSVSVPDNGTYKAGDSLLFTVHFNNKQVVSGAPRLVLNIGGQTAYAQHSHPGDATGAEEIYFTYTVEASIPNGALKVVSIDLNGGNISHPLNGNHYEPNLSLQNIAPTTGIAFDTIAPTPTITSSVTSPTGFKVTITFSEPVNGLTESDIIVTNAQKVNFVKSDDKTYNLYLLCKESAEITVSVPANVTTDKVGNFNAASNVLRINYIRVVTDPPTAENASVAKTSKTQASVSFTLTTAPIGTYRVHASQNTVAAHPTVTASLSGNTLTLTSSSGNMDAGNYYISVTEAGKIESDLLMLTVEPYAYCVWVGTTAVTENNYQDVLGDATVSYDPSSKTLTLSNVNINISHPVTQNSANDTMVGIYALDDLNLVLNGTSAITSQTSVKYSYGIYAEKSLSISGAGTLNITASKGHTENIGIKVKDDMRLNGGHLKLSADSISDDGASYGIWMYNNSGNLYISDGSLVALSGTGAVDGALSKAPIYVDYHPIVRTGNNADNAVVDPNPSYYTRYVAIERAPETYTITYNANGGTGTMNNGTATENVAFTLPSNSFTAPAGKRFKTWAIGSVSGTNVSPGAAHTFTANTTVYAIWEDIPATTYTITLNVNGGNALIPGTLTTDANGKLTSLPTPTRSGDYTFKYWSTSPSGGNLVSTNTVFRADTTIYALWTYTGDSSGGGSSGDSSNGGSTVTTPPSTNVPNLSTNLPMTLSGVLDGPVLTFSLSQSVLVAMIPPAVSFAPPSPVHFYITSNEARSPVGVALNLPKPVQNHIISQGIPNTNFVINRPDIQIGIDLNAMREVNRQASSDVTITATQTNSSVLSSGAQSAIGSRPVFDFSAETSRGVQISNFGSGLITIGIPYTLGANENPSNIQAVYVDGNGGIQWVPNSFYDSTNRQLVLSTNHFSTYGVGYKPNATAVTDIATHWAKDDITFMLNRGVLKNTFATTFSPNSAMTRGEFVSALGRLAKANVSIYRQSSFADVKKDADYMGYVEWANKNNILKGADGRFAPDQAITREQMAVALQNYSKAIERKLTIVQLENVFADSANIITSAKDAVKQMQMAGVICGKIGNRFEPQSAATRAEVAATLKRWVVATVSNDTTQGWRVNDSGQRMYYENGKPVAESKSTNNTYTLNQQGVLADLPKNGKYTAYTVQRGDSLWRIAHKLGCSIHEVEQLNNKTRTDLIHPGEVLQVPEK